MTQASGRRPLAADMFRAKQAPSLAALPSVEKLARKLAEAQSAVLSSFSSAPWRVAVDRIGEKPRFASDDHGHWARAESAVGSVTFHQGFDRPAISALCECAMGGTGAEAAFASEDRPLSAIEKEIAQHIGMKLVAGLAAALSDHLNMPVSLFDGQIAMDESAANSEMLVMHFIANVFGHSGEVSLWIPKAELMAQLDATGGPGDQISAADEQKVAMQRQISKAESQFVVSLGNETMLVEEIAALVPGRLVRLAATTASPVIVSSGGTPVYTASLARSGEQLAVCITAPTG